MGQDTLQHFYAVTRALEPSDQLVTRTLGQHARGARSATRSSGRRRRSRRVVLLVAAATVAVATTAVSAVSLGLVQLDDPSHQLVDPKAAQTTGLPVIMTAPEATGLYCRGPGRIVEAGATGRDPVAICAALWRKGVVSGTAEQPPALQACVGTNGAIEVYPGAMRAPRTAGPSQRHTARPTYTRSRSPNSSAPGPQRFPTAARATSHRRPTGSTRSSLSWV